MLNRLNLTRLILPDDLIPQGITETLEMPNLKVVTTIDESLYINIGANCPIKTLNFGTFILNSQQASKLSRLVKNLKGNQSVFWLKDPFDFNASTEPDFNKYRSFTQGVAIFDNIDNSRADLYKLYAIQTNRGYKGYLRRIYRMFDEILIGENNYEALPPQVENEISGDLTNELHYSLVDLPNSIPRYLHDRGVKLSFYASKASFNFLTPFRIISDFSVTPLNSNTCERLYQVSGLLLKEVILPFHNNIKAGFKSYDSPDDPNALPNSQAGFSPASRLRQQEESEINSLSESLVNDYGFY